MAKSKHGPALFELMKGARPESVSAREDEAEAPEGPPAPTPPIGEASAMEPPAEVEERAPAVVEAGETAAVRGALAEVYGDRIRFSLTQRTATIVAGVAVLVVLFAGYLGFRMGHARGVEQGRLAVQEEKVDAIEQARQAAPTQNLFEGVGNDPTAAATPDREPVLPRPAPPAAPAPAAEPPAWISGHTYIVVQEFKADARGDAERARDFLLENGVETAIVPNGAAASGRCRLITATGFNRDDPVQKKLADEYRDRVRRIGQAYGESGGRYDFNSAYFMKLTGDHW